MVNRRRFEWKKARGDHCMRMSNVHQFSRDTRIGEMMKSLRAEFAVDCRSENE